MDFKADDQVTVRKPLLRGDMSEIKCGRVVSVTGDRVSVQFPGDFKTEDFSVDKVALASKSFGVGVNFDNPHEMPITKLYR